MQGTDEKSVARSQVLVVDDEPLVALYIADVVEDAGGVDVETAASGEEAIAAAELRPPDVAIVDVSLGTGTSGPAVAANLRAAHQTAIIFLSGHTDLRDDPAVRNVEPIAILSKPCLPADLEKALQAALAVKQRRLR